MKRKLVGILCVSVLAFSITACGGSKDNKSTEEATQTEENAEEAQVTEILVAEGQEVTEETQESKVEETSNGIVSTVTGTFNGFVDDTTVEILVDGNPVEYKVTDPDVKAEIGAKSSEESFQFEATDDTKEIKSLVKTEVIEPEEVSVTEEETAQGIKIGMLLRYASDNKITVQVGEEEIDYIFSDVASKELLDCKVNFGYDVKFQEDTEASEPTIKNFIY